MSAHSEVAVWGLALLREKTAEFETVRRKAARKWNKGKQLHKVRTSARRLRAWVEDLSDCVTEPQALLDACKKIGEETTQARDAQVMIERLNKYRRFAMPSERAEIRAVYNELDRQRKAGLKVAKAAIKECRVKLDP